MYILLPLPHVRTVFQWAELCTTWEVDTIIDLWYEDIPPVPLWKVCVFNRQQTPDDNSWAKEGHTIIGSSKAAAVGHTTLYLPVWHQVQANWCPCQCRWIIKTAPCLQYSGRPVSRGKHFQLSVARVPTSHSDSSSTRCCSTPDKDGLLLSPQIWSRLRLGAWSWQ